MLYVGFGRKGEWVRKGAFLTRGSEWSAPRGVRQIILPSISVAGLPLVQCCA